MTISIRSLALSAGRSSARSLAVAGCLLLVTCAGCSTSRPTDRVEFAEVWLQSVVDSQHGSDCSRVEDWMTDHGKALTSTDCRQVFAEAASGTPSWSGVTEETDVAKEGNCHFLSAEQAAAGDDMPSVIDCFDHVYVSVTGPKGNLMSDGFTKH